MGAATTPQQPGRLGFASPSVLWFAGARPLLHAGQKFIAGLTINNPLTDIHQAIGIVNRFQQRLELRRARLAEALASQVAQ